MAASIGVQFPMVEGQRSTQRTSRDVLSHAARSVDPALADAIAAADDWRHQYPDHVRALTAASARSGAAASAIARAGLDRLHATFEFVGADGPANLGATVAGDGERAFGTRRVQGRHERVTELVVPYRGSDLRGEQIVAQADDWVRRGVAEPSFVAAMQRVIEHPEWLDLGGRAFALLGAGAEMGPTEHLLAWGADVLAVDVPAVRVWERLEALATAGAGTLHVPTRADGGDGADLLTEPAEVRRWLAAWSGPFVLGNYAYADGADFVRVAMAADAVIAGLQARRADVGLAYLATPTDVFAVPASAVAMARARQARARGVGRLAAPMRAMTGGRAFVPTYRDTLTTDDGRVVGIADSLVVQQGPNYALAKRLQRWRALVARQDGAFSSVHVAPPTLTRSVTKNRILAAAYRGAHIVEVEPLAPDTSRAIMAALLVHDLHHAASGATSDTGDVVEHDLTVDAVHGGLWRIAWEPRSALGLAVAAGALVRS